MIKKNNKNVYHQEKEEMKMFDGEQNNVSSQGIRQIVDRCFVFLNDIHSLNKFSKQKKIVDHFRTEIVKLKHTSFASI